MRSGGSHRCYLLFTTVLLFCAGQVVIPARFSWKLWHLTTVYVTHCSEFPDYFTPTAWVSDTWAATRTALPVFIRDLNTGFIRKTKPTIDQTSLLIRRMDKREGVSLWKKPPSEFCSTGTRGNPTGGKQKSDGPHHQNLVRPRTESRALLL